VSATGASESATRRSGRRSLRDRAASAVEKHGPSWVKWLVVAVATAVIGAHISDHFADRQRELELEAGLITTISRGAVTLFQQAQEASRATGDPRQIVRRDRAADAWVLRSSELEPVFFTYFDGTDVREHWSQYQNAMYQWAVLGCCTSGPGRMDLVRQIRDYLEEYVGPPNRRPPTQDPWTTLGEDQVDRETYQWLGFYLLRGRGALGRDLKEASPELD
jgi:hypothetical protein